MKNHNRQIHATVGTYLFSNTVKVVIFIILSAGAMPAVEKNYWRLPSGPAWAWWILAILPLDTQAQVNIYVSSYVFVFLLIFVIVFYLYHPLKLHENLSATSSKPSPAEEASGSN